MCKNPVDLIIKQNQVILKPEVKGMDPRMMITTDETKPMKKEKEGKKNGK